MQLTITVVSYVVVAEGSGRYYGKVHAGNAEKARSSTNWLVREEGKMMSIFLY